MIPFLKDSSGKPSVSFTMMLLAFIATFIWYVANIFATPHIRAFDASASMSFLSPLMALYFSRKWADEKKAPVTTAEAMPTIGQVTGKE